MALSEIQAAQALALTTAFKAQQNRDAAKIAALIAVYYARSVEPSSLASVEQWLDLMVPNLIKASDDGAGKAATFFDGLRRVEGVNDSFRATPTLGQVDPGVRKSLLTVGPYDYMNKASQIERLDVGPQQQAALLRQAKQASTKKIAMAAVRHAQAGGRQTILDNTERDETTLGWVRVTREDPCYFCAMLASRGLNYRAYKEGAFEMSDARYTGPGTAKVHDQCGCSLKPVRAENDPLLERTEKFTDFWSEWGAGGGDAALRFRRGYEHYQKTGEKLTWEQANEGLRAA